MATISRLTGFKPELLRAWEHRHHLLAPARGAGGQRLYSDQDLALLHGVRALIAEGRSIGEIAALGRRQLLGLARNVPAPAAGAATATRHAPPSDEAVLLYPSPPWRTGRPDPGATRGLQIAARAVSRLSARLEPARLLQLVVETLAADFQAALARIWVHEPGANTLWLRASAGLSRRTRGSSRARIDLRSYRFKVGVVGRSGEPFLSNDISADGEFDQRWVRKERLASVAILPLMADDAMYGVLASFFRVALSTEVTGALELFSALAAGSLAAHDGGARRAADRLMDKTDTLSAQTGEAATPRRLTI